MADRRVIIQFDGSGNLDSKLDLINKRLQVNNRLLGRQSRDMRAAGDAASRSARGIEEAVRSQRNMGRELDKNKRKFDSFTSKLKVGLIYYWSLRAARGINNIGKELGTTAVQAGRARAQFDALARARGQNPGDVFGRLEASTRGRLSQGELARVASSSITAGISVDELDIAIKASQTRAAQRGERFVDALDRTTQAIKTLEIEPLINLGIDKSLLTEGQSRDERKGVAINFLSQLGKSAPTDDAGIKIEKIQARVANFRNNVLGGIATSPGVNDFLDKIEDFFSTERVDRWANAVVNSLDLISSKFSLVVREIGSSILVQAQRVSSSPEGYLFASLIGGVSLGLLASRAGPQAGITGLITGTVAAPAALSFTGAEIDAFAVNRLTSIQKQFPNPYGEIGRLAEEFPPSDITLALDAAGRLTDKRLGELGITPDFIDQLDRSKVVVDSLLRNTGPVGPSRFTTQGDGVNQKGAPEKTDEEKEREKRRLAELLSGLRSYFLLGGGIGRGVSDLDPTGALRGIGALSGQDKLSTLSLAGGSRRPSGLELPVDAFGRDFRSGAIPLNGDVPASEAAEKVAIEFTAIADIGSALVDTLIDANSNLKDFGAALGRSVGSVGQSLASSGTGKLLENVNIGPGAALGLGLGLQVIGGVFGRIFGENQKQTQALESIDRKTEEQNKLLQRVLNAPSGFQFPNFGYISQGIFDTQ